MPGDGQEASVAAIVDSEIAMCNQVHGFWAERVQSSAGDEELLMACPWIDGSPLTPESIAQMGFVRSFEDLVEVLAGLKASGVCHADIKEDNVFISDDGRFVPIDFGNSHPLGDAPKGYIKPPQVARDAAPELHIEQQAHTKSDVFSLGVMLFRLLAQARGEADKKQHPFPLWRMTLERGQKKSAQRARIMLTNLYLKLESQIAEKSDFEGLLVQCIHPIAEERPSLEEIRKLLNNMPEPEILSATKKNTEKEEEAAVHGDKYALATDEDAVQRHAFNDDEEPKAKDSADDGSDAGGGMVFELIESQEPEQSEEKEEEEDEDNSSKSSTKLSKSSRKSSKSSKKSVVACQDDVDDSHPKDEVEEVNAVTAQEENEEDDNVAESQHEIDDDDEEKDHDDDAKKSSQDVDDKISSPASTPTDANDTESPTIEDETDSQFAASLVTTEDQTTATDQEIVHFPDHLESTTEGETVSDSFEMSTKGLPTRVDRRSSSPQCEHSGPTQVVDPKDSVIADRSNNGHATAKITTDASADKVEMSVADQLKQRENGWKYWRTHPESFSTIARKKEQAKEPKQSALSRRRNYSEGIQRRNQKKYGILRK